jgi:hypothetical protein
VNVETANIDFSEGIVCLLFVSNSSVLATKAEKDRRTVPSTHFIYGILPLVRIIPQYYSPKLIELPYGGNLSSLRAGM